MTHTRVLHPTYGYGELVEVRQMYGRPFGAVRFDMPLPDGRPFIGWCGLQDLAEAPEQLELF